MNRYHCSTRKHFLGFVGRDACRLGIAPCRWSPTQTARYPETTRGIAPYNLVGITQFH
jgi:hypothetical protein